MEFGSSLSGKEFYFYFCTLEFVCVGLLHFVLGKSLTGLSSLRSQITAQEKSNVDLAKSNTALRKVHTDLGESNKELSLKLVKLIPK